MHNTNPTGPTLLLRRQLFAAINTHVEQLAREIEAHVCTGLALPRLAPADMRIRPPSAEQFHASLQDLFSRGEALPALPPFFYVVTGCLLGAGSGAGWGWGKDVCWLTSGGTEDLLAGWQAGARRQGRLPS